MRMRVCDKSAGSDTYKIIKGKKQRRCVMVFEYDKNSKEKMPYEYYISEFAKANPIETSNRLAVPYDTKGRRFLFPFLTNNYYFSWPDLTVISKTQEEAYNPFEKSVFTKVLVLRYLLYATPLLPNGEFRSFRELPLGICTIDSSRVAVFLD